MVLEETQMVLEKVLKVSEGILPALKNTKGL